MKIEIGTIRLDNMNSETIEELISSTLNWLDCNKTKSSDTIMKALVIINQGLAYVSYDYIQVLLSNQATCLINDISLLDIEYRDICNQIMNLLVNHSNISNSQSVYKSLTKPILEAEGAGAIDLDELSIGANKYILNHKLSFPTVNIAKEDVQRIFDLNISLKFGDHVQIAKVLSILYNEIFNNYPIEYFLQNSEIFRTLFNFIEKADFNEFGMMIWKIMNRTFHLLEKKLQYFKESYMILHRGGTQSQVNTSVGSDNMKYNNFAQLYPNTNTTTEETSSGLSVRDFLILSVESLIVAMYKLDNFTLAFDLLDRGFSFLKKVITNGEDDEMIAIFTQLIKKLNSLLSFHKNKNIIPLKRFVIKFLGSFNVKFFSRFVQTTTPDILASIKDIVFNINDKRLVLNFFDKIEKVKALLEQEKLVNRGDTLIHELTSIIEDYNNAQTIKNSIDIVNHIKKKDDYDYILDNFLNIIIAVSYNSYEFNNDTVCGSSLKSNVTEKQNNSTYSIGNFISSGGSQESIDISRKRDNSSVFPFIKVLCEAYDNALNKNKVSACLRKLISYCNFGSCNAGFKFYLYSSLLEAIEIKPSAIMGIIINDPGIIWLFLNDLYTEDTQLRELILSVIYEITKYLRSLRDPIDAPKHVFQILPYYPKSLKLNSLHSHMDCELNQFEKNRKYFRNLFSTDEFVRLNIINYFMSTGFDKKIIEFVEYSQNYESIKSVDTIYNIQSAEGELKRAYEELTSENTYSVELYPLLNIIYSDRIELNMKTSALEQLCFLVNADKYRYIFTIDLFTHLVQDLIRILITKDEYGADVLNYMTGVLKLVDLIILFNMNNENIRDFLWADDDKAGAWLLARNLISKVLFKKTISRYLLPTFAITYVFILGFIKLPADLSVGDDDTKGFTLPILFKKNYLNITPITAYKPFNGTECSFWEKLVINKYIWEYIKTSERPIQNTFDMVAIRRSMKDHLGNNDGEFNYIDIYYSTLRFFNYIIYMGSCGCELSDKEVNSDLMRLVNLMKKLLPLHSKDKNIICDIFSIINIFHSISKEYKIVCGFDLILVRNFSEISLTYINFLVNDKNFLRDFGAENEQLLSEILVYLTQILNDSQDKNITLPTCALYPFYKYKNVVFKFNDIFANYLTDTNRFAAFRNIYIKFQYELLELDTYTKDLNFIHNINSIVSNIYNNFYKLDLRMLGSYQNYNGIMNYLNYLIRVSNQTSNEQVNGMEGVIKFIPIWTFVDFPNQVLVALTKIVSAEMLLNYPKLISVVYDLCLEQTSSCLVKINCLNFINTVLEYVMKNATLDSKDIYYEIISMNDEFFQENTVLILLNIIEKSVFNSLFSACTLKLIQNILSVVNETQDLTREVDMSSSIYLNSAFYNCVSYIISRELESIENTDTQLPEVILNDKTFNDKLKIQRTLNSVLHVNEVLFMIIKSLLKVEFTTVLANCSLLNLSFESIFVNLQAIVNKVDQWYNNTLKSCESELTIHCKYAMSDLSTKLLTLIHLIYLNDEMFIYNQLISENSANIFDTLFLILKWEDDNDTNINTRLGYAKLLPYMVNTVILFKQNGDELILNNEGDILLKLMTAVKIMYNIKMDSYSVGTKCNFDLDDDINISQKNSLIYAVSAILLYSQNAKQIFVKSGFINAFFDYVRQITERMFNTTINRTSACTKLKDSVGTKSCNTEYLVNEFKNVLILLQNFVYGYEGFDDKTQKEFIRLLYDIFLETIRHSNDLFENYMKLLINYIAKNDEAKKAFTVPISK
jgi:hypothetical protein